MEDRKCDVCNPLDKQAFPKRCDTHNKCDICSSTEHLAFTKGGLYCYECREKLIEEEIKQFNGDTNFTNNIICPYCGSEDGDSWEETQDWGEIECGNCYKTFYFEREISVTYTTTKIEDLK